MGHFGVVEMHPRTRTVRPTARWRALVDEIKALSDVRLVVLDTMQAMAGGVVNPASYAYSCPKGGRMNEG